MARILGTAAAEAAYVDKFLAEIDSLVCRIAKEKGRVRRLHLESDLLFLFGVVRDRLRATIPKIHRQLLLDVYGGDCERISRLIVVLDCQFFTSFGAATDRRVSLCRAMCRSVEDVLADRGLSDRLKETQALAHQRFELLQFGADAALKQTDSDLLTSIRRDSRMGDDLPIFEFVKIEAACKIQNWWRALRQRQMAAFMTDVDMLRTKLSEIRSMMSAVEIEKLLPRHTRVAVCA